MTCPNCAFKNQPDAKICIHCGDLLIEAFGTKNMAVDKENRINQKLIIQVLDSDTKFIFNTLDIEEVIIGRKNPDTGEIPSINLDIVNGLEWGVSRNHAIIVRHEHILYITDSKSAGGTLLNNQRLIPDNLRILRDGDNIRVGGLTLSVSFN